MNKSRMIEWLKKHRRLAYLAILPSLAFLSVRIADTFLIASQIEKTDSTRIIMLLLSAFLVLLSYVVFRKFFLLFIEYRRRVAGSMIKLRLTISFLIVTIIPVFLFIIFIFVLMSAGLKAVYHPKIERALETSISVLKHERTLFRKKYKKFASSYFRRTRRLFITENFNLQNFSVRLASRVRSIKKLPKSMQQVISPGRLGVSFRYVKEDARSMLLYINANKQFHEVMAVILPQKFQDEAATIVSALHDYKQIRQLREPMRIALLFIVLLIVVVITLLVMLAAMRLARYFSNPINALAEGTRRIASGDLSYRVADVGSDELRLLVDNFNAMTDELQKSRQRLYHAERIAAWQEVAKRLAHEIKNPLTPIQLAAERVLRQTKKGAADINQIIEKALPAIISEVGNIRRLVDEFASFARLPQKRVEAVDINAFVDGIVESFRHAHFEVTFEFEPLAEEQSVTLDPGQFRRVLTNLIKNGISASESRGKDARIVVALSLNSGNVIFSVTDNGKGIPDDIGDDIFSPYFSATQGGTGLGLAIVEKIVVDHEGKVWFVTKEGEGSAFFVELPIHKVEEKQNG